MNYQEALIVYSFPSLKKSKNFFRAWSVLFKRVVHWKRSQFVYISSPADVFLVKSSCSEGITPLANLQISAINQIT